MFNKLLLISSLFSAPLIANEVPFTSTKIHIDGIAEPAWQHATWHKMTHLMAGQAASSDDFSAQYKLLWDEEYLYLQVEMTSAGPHSPSPSSTRTPR